MESLNRILNKCVHSGAEMAEVFQLSEKQLMITVRNGTVETIKKSTPGGLAIRYFSFGKTAFAHTTDFSDSAIDSLISKLSRLVKKTGSDEHAGLPVAQDYQQGLDIYGPEFIDISTDHKIEYLVNLDNLAKNYDPLIERSNGATYVETLTTKKLVNTNGVSVNFDSTLYKVVLLVTASRKGEMFPGEGEYFARYFTDLPRPQEIVDRVASQAIRLIGGSTVSNGEYEIIFTPQAKNSILWGMLFAFNGENYHKGSSFLYGKKGSKIANDRLNLYNDPLMTRGVASRPADDEGTASRKQELIKNGVLNDLMYDTRSASKAKTVSNGSAAREHYSSFPEIFPSNFYVAGGNDKAEDVVASCKKGIIVEMTQGWGLHSVTGQYSAGINGILVKNGKRIKPVANVTVAADTESLLGGIGAICDDITFFNRFSAPTIMIKKMKVGS